ncbi:MAG: hypothetical protein DMF82_14065 [Acidobacteria bacterium]|nr:MAG: hypothetical protein DMF82_14065 [Acidobacteriota bacterium]
MLIARGLAGYRLFLKVRPTALLTWPVRRPAHFPFLLALGAIAAALAVINSTMNRPFHHVYSQGVMAVYFTVMVPLSARIQLGLYRDGVWADAGFLPYEKIARMAFREVPEIVLIMVPRGRSGAFRLPVPSSEYGAVRKILEDKIRARVVNPEKAILGL